MTPKRQALPHPKVITGSDYEFEIQYIPLPAEKRAEWELAMEILNAIILQAIENQRLADGAQQEPSQVNNGTESMKSIGADSITSRFDFDDVTL